MKIFKIFALLTVSLLMFTGCDDDEITNYAFQEISAPANVTAAFNVMQDDSGTVTVTPSGDGASVFQVFFGDTDNETPVEVAAGESITNVYDEGEFLVRVVALGPTGLTSEFNQRLLISFRAPENLEVTVTQAASNPAIVSISATADFAATFDVFFGDEEDEEATQLMPGGSIEHTYEAPGTYIIRVVAKGAGAATAETTVEVVVPEANDPVKLPITFDIPTVNYALGTFNGATFEVVANPFLSGANPEESMVGAITNSGANFEGGAYNLGESVDFSGDNKTISMKSYSDQPVSVLVKFEGGTNDDRPNEVSVDHGGTGWEVLTFDFGTNALTSFVDGADDNGQAFVPTGKYSTLVLFVEIGKTTTGTFYFDDIAQEGMNGDPFKLPVDFDGSTAYASRASGVAFEVVTNPKQSGINSTNTKVGAVTNTGSQFEALTFILDEAIDFSGSNKTITMKVYSETAYPVLFKLETGVNGERANEVEVNHGGTGWEELTFNFANSARKSFVDGDPENGADFVPTGQYDEASIFLDFAGTTAGTFYIDDIAQSDGGGASTSTKTSFPVNLETAANGGAAANWSVFENVDNPPLEIIANPGASGVNTSATVAKFTARQTGQPFAGTITQLQTPFTLSTSNSTVKVLVWKSVISDVGIKFENAAGGSTGEIRVANTKTNEWEELTFDFSGVIGDPNNTNITGLIVFPDFNARSQETVSYFDNITLNAAGSGGGGGTSGGTDPTAAAPTPTLAPANVISMFSDAYTDVAVDTWRTVWSDATLEDVTVEGNATKKYTALSFVGIEATTTPIDASGMTHFHTDIWTANATEIKIKLVDFGANGSFDGGADDVEHEVTIANPTQSAWVSLDIPLSQFTGLTTKSHIAQLIYSAAPSGSATVYVDNVYFHN